MADEKREEVVVERQRSESVLLCVSSASYRRRCVTIAFDAGPETGRSLAGLYSATRQSYIYELATDYLVSTADTMNCSYDAHASNFD